MLYQFLIVFTDFLCSSSSSSSSATMMDPDMAGQDMGVGKLGTQAEKDRRLKKK